MRLCSRISLARASLNCRESAHGSRPLGSQRPLFSSDDHEGLCTIPTLCRQGKLDQAVDALLLRWTPPGPHLPALSGLYLLILEACSRAKALDQVKRVHSLAPPHLLHLLGDSFVVAFVRCGALHDAYRILVSLPVRSVYAWTALISGYTAQGHGFEALVLHRHMREDGVEPNHYTFATLFKACALVPDLLEAEKLHMDAQKKGMTLDIVVSNALVSMYGKCGCILEAEMVFCGLSQRNVVSWNAMLSAYTEQGQGEKALRLYRQLKHEGISPNPQTFLITLQACGILVDEKKAILTQSPCLEIQQALHSELKKKGFLSDLFVSNTLVSVYGKCGSIVDAANVFIKSFQHDVVSWTAMLSAYLEQGKGQEVLQLFRQMLEEGVCPNEQTFLIAFPACGTFTQREVAMVEERHLIQATYFQICQALHADVKGKGLTLDVFISNTLINVYGKCGSIAEAENIFIKLSKRDVVSWNAMLSAYVEQGQGDRALLLYRQMQHENEGNSSSQQSFLITLHACCSLVEKEEAISGGEITQNIYLEIGQALHADSQKKGLASDVFISNTLVNMYGKSGRLMEAKQVFNGLSQATVISWTAILSACAEQHQGEEALQLYRQMQEEGICPDQQGVMMGLQACVSLVKTEEAREEGSMTLLVPLKIGQALHADAKREGFDIDVFVGSFLIKLYGKCGSIEDAECVFDDLCEHSSVPWNSLLLVYVEQNQQKKALRLLCRMQDEGMALDDYSITRALEACRTILSVEICKQLHFSVVAAGQEHFLMLGTALIRAYGRCAFMVDAQAVFDGLSQRDTGSWAACIAGYAQEGNAVACFHMYNEMLLAGCTPDGLTFFSLLSVCGRAGLVEKGFHLFESMSRVHDFTPNWRHYVAIIGLLGRAGEFKRVEHILLRMSVQANWELWMCVLGACHTYCNVDLGKQAFDHAVVLKPNDAAAYLLMFNIYSDAGMHGHAADIQKRFNNVG